jgi:hypothetical protein
MLREMRIFVLALVVLALYALAFTAVVVTGLAVLQGLWGMVFAGPWVALFFFVAGRTLDRNMWGRGA